MTSCSVLQHFLYSQIKDSGNRRGGKMLEQSVHSKNKLGPFTMLLSELHNSTAERLQVRSSAAAARAEQGTAGHSRASCPRTPGPLGVRGGCSRAAAGTHCSTAPQRPPSHLEPDRGLGLGGHSPHLQVKKKANDTHQQVEKCFCAVHICNAQRRKILQFYTDVRSFFFSPE